MYNIELNEVEFTNICKSGFLTKMIKNETSDIRFTSNDMRLFLSESEVIKDVVDDKIKFKVYLDDYLKMQIIKRSPIYSNLF
jgi:hypothetical protein